MKNYKITSEEHLWTSDHKLKFCGYGEWVEELDRVIFEYEGYKARVERIFRQEPYAKNEAWFGGHLCGYVTIPQSHPYFKKEEIDIDCHWGLTFNEAHEEHVIGFDCAHSGDIVPTMQHLKNTDPHLIAIRQEFFPKGYSRIFKEQYRNVQFCIDQCIAIIEQLIIASIEHGTQKTAAQSKEADEKETIS